MFILGGYQSDFSRNIAREGLELVDLVGEVARGTLEACGVDAASIDAVHVGNFTAELFCGQGHLGAMVASAVPGLAGKPAARHEAACASGSVAAMSALAGLGAGFADLTLLIGVEMMRNVDGSTAADHLGAAAFRGHEGTEARYLWPHLFSRIADAVADRHGLDRGHLAAIAEKNLANARNNPLAQTRGWTLTPHHFEESDELNPVIEGQLRRADCAQITDGGAGLIVATPAAAARWADEHGRDVESLARIAGWGHRTGRLDLESKLAAGGGGVMFPHLAAAIDDARERAGVDLARLSAIELHDCFTITEYVLYEHLGLCGPGGAAEVIDAGTTRREGALPVNPSGGLIGAGHPVGATGVRMLLDASRQVTNGAGDCQIPGATAVQTVNIGGSAATAVSFVVTGPG